MRGPQVNLYHPDTVYIYFDKYANGLVIARLAGQISLTNTGELGRDAILRDLEVIASIGDAVVLDEYWSSFPQISREDTVLNLEPKDAAHPLTVNGGSAASQMVAFAPVPLDCESQSTGSVGESSKGCNENANYVSDDSFLEAIAKARHLTLVFKARTFNADKPIESSCSIEITPNLLQVLARNDWCAARCFSNENN